MSLLKIDMKFLREVVHAFGLEMGLMVARDELDDKKPIRAVRVKVKR